MRSMRFSWIAFGVYLLCKSGGSRAAAISIVRNNVVLNSRRSTPLAVAGSGTSLLTSTGPIITGRATTFGSSPAPFLIIIAVIVFLIVGLSVGLLARMHYQKPSRHLKTSVKSPEDSSEELDTASVSHTIVNRASWEPYISAIRSPEHALMHSNTMSTQRLYISNQAHRARQKEMEIFSENRTGTYEELRNPSDPEGPSEPFITQSPEALTAATTISTRQRYISAQISRTREKVTELEEMVTLLRSSSQASRSSSATLTSRADQNVRYSAAGAGDASITPDDPHSRDVQDELQRAMQQIDVLDARIHELERQRNSA
ncbi:hypothetical protein DFH09DRAFT_1185470 [Mycena vulgaris]|nr:hypothetical protein DFH09DRAFT_1185470 [Mycena vulgaris]